MTAVIDCRRAPLLDAAAFTAELRGKLTAAAAEADGGYPDNEDLFIEWWHRFGPEVRRGAGRSRPSRGAWRRWDRAPIP